MKMRLFFEKILSVPKSFWVSIHYFSFKDAWKLPIMVRYNTCLYAVGGIIKVDKASGLKRGMLSFGFGGVGVFDKKYERSIWEVNGVIELSGKAAFGHGSRLSVGKEAIVSIGVNFCNTAALTLVSQKRIIIGNNVTTSWNTLVMDTDWHHIINLETKEVNSKTKEIIIGDNCWLCTRSIVLKGCVIPNGCIVGANAVCSRKYSLENSIIAGNPAEVRKEHVTMCKD